MISPEVLIVNRVFCWPIVLSVAIATAPLAIAADLPVASTQPTINLRNTVTVDVVRKTKDAVVYISTTRLMRTSPFGDDLEFLFPELRQNVPVQSLGSGFLVHEDGYVVTNNHVIDRAREIQVDLPDGRKFPAALIAADPDADLAILKIDADKPLPRLELGDSSDLLIGEPVIAVGNPLGYSHSVSTGIVSAIHRKLEDPRINLQDLIQTDAAINPGNSGGPLLNAYGQVIGINTAIRGDAQNIGFAIQVNRLRELIPSLLDPRHAAKIELPIRLSERRTVTPPATVTCAIEALDGNGNRRTVATINGQRPRDIIDAYVILLRTKVNAKLTVRYDNGAEEALVAKSTAPPDAIVQARKRLGVSVEPLTPMLAQKYGLAPESGMLIVQVVRDTPAERAQLRPGDVITCLGRYAVRSLEDFGTLLQYLPRSGRVPVKIIRGDEEGYITLRLSEPD